MCTRTPVLLLLASLPPLMSSNDYRLLYGSVVASDVFNVSTADSDVAIAVQVAQKAVQYHTASKDGHVPALHSVSKSMLYYSADGETPFVFEQKFIVSNRIYLQRVYLLLGMLFSVSLSSSGTPYCPSVWHNLTITRDHRKDYHIYQHTSSWRWDISRSVVNDTDSCVRKQIEKKGNLFEKNLRYSATCPTSSDYWTKSIEKWPSESPLGAIDSDYLFQPPFYLAASCGQHWCPHTRCQHQLCGSIQTDTLSGCQVVKVATYNVWNLNHLESEEYEDRLGRLGKMIRSQALDIVGFQEVRLEAAYGTQHQIGQLAHFLPHYQPAMLYMHNLNVRTEEGVAIFSRYPILSSDYILLYRNESDEDDYHQRVCLHAEILVPLLGKIHVFVTHLSLSSAVQERSVVELWHYLSRFRGVKLLLGDLNAEPESVPIRFLLGEHTLGSVHTEGLYDTWRIGGTGRLLDGLTFSALDNHPTKRIDYIFLHQPSKEVFVVNTTVMKDDEHCYSPCSDHYGVVTTLGFHCV